MRKTWRTTLKCLGAAAALCAILAWGAAPARAQSIQALQEHIQNLEKQLNLLKEQLKAIQEEQKAQKAKVEKTEKAVEPLADIKKAVENLSKIEISGGATGTLQATSGAPRALGEDEAFSGGSFDLVLTYMAMKNVKVVIDLEAIGGDGPDSRFPTFAGLNGDLGTTNDLVTALEAYVEATFLDNRLTVTAGKIDLTNYIDGNAFAGSETSQFLSGAFVNNAVLGAPDNGPGVRVRYELVPMPEAKSDYKFGLYVEAGAINGDRDLDGLTTNKTFEDVYGAVEVGLTTEIHGRKGTYRFWGFADGAAQKYSGRGIRERYTAYGAGISFDQELADWLGVFLRAGYRDSGNLNFNTQAAWSAGVQLASFLPGRKDDVLGFAYGAIKPAKRTVATRPVKTENLYELYYRWHFTEKFHFSPLVQYLLRREGSAVNDPLWVFGARLQIDF